MDKIDKNAGFFSPLRWSPGSIIIVALLTVINIFLIVGGILLNSKFLIYVSIVGIAVEVLIVMIKGFEILIIMDNKPFTYEEKIGVAMTDILPGKDGVIKVKNELWSARSNEKIKKNDRVIVEKQEGLYLIVKRKI
ncbi:MAG: NfeD family protein [Thermoplasmata archaeon]